MTTTISIPNIYQDVQGVSVAGNDFIELNFSDPPAKHIIHIQSVTGTIGVSTSAPTIKASIQLLGGSDGGLLALIPSTETVLTPPAHGGQRTISLNNIVDFYTDSRPIIRIFLESSNSAIALLTVTGYLCPSPRKGKNK